MPLSKEEFTRRVGQRIRECRNDQNLTIEDLAVAAEMEYTQLSRIERGKINTGIFHLYKIAGSLGIQMHEMLGHVPLVSPATDPHPSDPSPTDPAGAIKKPAKRRTSKKN